MLVVFGGLPGTGKTTLASAYAHELQATYLRIDTIEQALRASGTLAADVGAAGYQVAYALAEANLRLGRTVVADSVNPLAVTRRAWREIAASAAAAIFEVELVCSDADEHRRRIESRVPDIEGLRLPTWQQVVDRAYDPWDQPHLVLDTAGRSPDEALAELRAAIVGLRG
ncbi:MAG TPA: AAA family ATPase [Aliidongia sp.]|nr:AAA family ATPase [Aliidongia sp.]